ncbi:MAG: sulfite exporter TauE/SafE family protein [Verrucomicrobiales bacterium]
MPIFTTTDWALALIAAVFCGVGKSGLAGLGMLNVLIMARLIPGTGSSGVVLPMLIAADVLAVSVFGPRNVDWRAIARLLPAILCGVVLGWQALGWLDHRPPKTFGALIGWIVLAMVTVQLLRQQLPALDRHLPHSRLFGAFVGLLVGVTTMIANAAGPISVIYFLILGFAKREFIATMAWLFLIVNIFKIPFSAHQGLITTDTLRFNALLLPFIAAGFFLGRWAVAKIPQKPFEHAVLALTVLSAMRLILG